jgi:pyruvate dehydrogenase E1 component beta subunit
MPIGQAEIRRRGADVTIVGTQLMCERALDAAALLAAEDGIEAEVIDLRTLAPLDVPTVVDSVTKTTRLVCVQESSFPGSWGASLVAAVATEAFDALDGPPVVVGGDETPIPYAAQLEAAWMPSAHRIVTEVKELIR